MNKYLILIFLFLHLHEISFSQQQELSLSQAITSLETNTNQLRLLEKDLAITQEQLATNKQLFLPKVGLTYSGAFTNSPLNAFGFKLNQELVQQADFVPDVLNNPDLISNFNTKIQVIQPLFNYDATLAKTQTQFQIEALEHQKEYALNQLTLQLKNAYTQLQLLYATQVVLQESEKAMQAHEQIVTNFVTQGLAKTSDQLAIQVKLKGIDNQKIAIANHINQTSAFIAYLIGDAPTTIYRPKVTIDKSITNNTILVDSISSNRADLQAYQKGIDAQGIALEMTKAQQLPRLNAFGEFNFNDASPVGFGGNNFMVGFTLSWQLHLGKQLKGKISSQQIALEKSALVLKDAKEKSAMQLQQAIAQHNMYLAQLANMNASLSLAEEQLRVTKNRFNEGLEKSADVLVAENQLSEVKLSIKQLQAKQQQSQHQLEFLLSENK